MKLKYFEFQILKNILKKLLICLIPLLIPFSFFFLIKNVKILNHKKIFLSYNWAFGHQILSLEGISRIYGSNQKIALIEVLSLPRNNPYLSGLYTKYFNIYQIKDFGLNHFARLNYYSLKFTLKLIQKVINNFELITYENFIKKMSKYNHKNSYSYNEINNKIQFNHNNSWFDIICKKKIKHSFSMKLEKKCEQFLKSQNINIKGKKVVNLIFREKQTKLNKKNIKGYGYYDLLRLNYKKENYTNSIKWLHKNGYVIFIHGIDNLKIKKKDFPNVFFVNNFAKNFDNKLINIYLLFKGDLHISQNSGSVCLAEALGKEIVVTECFPFCNGLPGKQMIRLLFPKIRISNKIYNLKNYVNTKYFFGEGFDNDRVKLIPNTSKQILNTIKDTKLNYCLNIKFPRNSSIYYRKNNKIYI